MGGQIGLGGHASDVTQRLERVRDGLAKARALKQIMRDAPDQLRRDAAIIAFSRNLDRLLEDIIALDDLGLLNACARRLAKAAEPGNRP